MLMAAAGGSWCYALSTVKGYRACHKIGSPSLSSSYHILLLPFNTKEREKGVRKFFYDRDRILYLKRSAGVSHFQASIDMEMRI